MAAAEDQAGGSATGGKVAGLSSSDGAVLLMRKQARSPLTSSHSPSSSLPAPTALPPASVFSSPQEAPPAPGVLNRLSAAVQAIRQKTQGSRMTSLVREQTMLGPRTVEDLLMIDQELWTPVERSLVLSRLEKLTYFREAGVERQTPRWCIGQPRLNRG